MWRAKEDNLFFFFFLDPIDFHCRGSLKQEKSHTPLEQHEGE